MLPPVCVLFLAGCLCLCVRVYVFIPLYLHVHVCCCCFCLYDHLPGCDFSDSGGFARKSVALSLILSPMKRVQSSPNLGTGTNTHKHTTNEHTLAKIQATSHIDWTTLSKHEVSLLKVACSFSQSCLGFINLILLENI